MRPTYWRAGLSGIVVGVVASFAMELAQKGLYKTIGSGDSSGGEPSTQKAAKATAGAAGYELNDKQSKRGGRLVHYVTGVALGITYALAAEREPRLGRAAGLPLALGTMVLLDEVAVPATGLGQPPTKAPAGTHLFSLASHLVFGLAAEGVRRLLGGRAPT